MFQFNILNEPPTAAQLRQIKSELLAKRRALLKYAGLSDCLHLVVFCALYFFGLLSGRGVLGVAVSSIVVALLLAARQDPSSKRFKVPLLVIVTGIVMLASYCFLVYGMHQPLAGALIAAVACGSVVTLGTLLGGQVKTVFRMLEEMQPMVDDHRAQRELQLLSHLFAEIRTYRQQASEILRPNLTYAELTAMKTWVKASGYTLNKGQHHKKGS